MPCDRKKMFDEAVWDYISCELYLLNELVLHIMCDTTYNKVLCKSITNRFERITHSIESIQLAISDRISDMTPYDGFELMLYHDQERMIRLNELTTTIRRMVYDSEIRKGEWDVSSSFIE